MDSPHLPPGKIDVLLLLCHLFQAPPQYPFFVEHFKVNLRYPVISLVTTSVFISDRDF